MPTVTIEFDNTALPWHTLAIVTGPDRPGVLLAVSAAFASAGVVLHTIRISTSDKHVSDRFGIGDHVGSKLDASAMNAIRLALTEGRTAHRIRPRR